MIRRILSAVALVIATALLIAYCAPRREADDGLPGTFENSTDIAENVGILQALEDQDVDEAQMVVDATQVEDKSEDFEFYFFTHDADSVDVSEYKTFFSGCVVVGDSISTGLLDYDFLNADQVIAEKGMTMTKIESDGSLETLQKRNPRIIFLSFGLNDLIKYKGDAEKYYERYTEFLSQIRETCPDAKIYVNSVFPVTSPMADENPYLADVTQYNVLLMYMCNENGATFIDNTSIVTEKMYAEDGAHFYASMYPYWLYNMAKSAYLK